MVEPAEARKGGGAGTRRRNRVAVLESKEVKKKETIGPPIGNRSSGLAVERDEDQKAEAEARENGG